MTAGLGHYDRGVPAAIDFARSVFVCSKPLQVLNCASIVRHFAIVDARLHVLTSAIDDAAGFREFLDGSDSRRRFSSISWNADVDDAIAEFTTRPYDSLFVEDDRLTSYLRFEPLRTERLVVFEEGIGTYRMSRDRSPRGLRLVKWRAIAAARGCGWHFGSGRRTDHVLVSRPEAFVRLHPRLAAKVVGFPGLVDELRHEADDWRRATMRALGEPVGPLGRVALVLATWGGTATAVLEEAAATADVVFEKPHPHDGIESQHPGVTRVDGSWIPAEAVVETLAAISDALTVYHHSSSAAFYAQGAYDDVEFVDLLGSEQLRVVLGALADRSS